MKIIDKKVLKTINWTIEYDDDTYSVQLQEDLTEDYWFIDSEEEGKIDVESKLGKFLIQLCTDSEK